MVCVRASTPQRDKKLLFSESYEKKYRRRPVHIDDPKYFEQAVSDYSDVVRLIQKVHPGYRTHSFFVSHNLVRILGRQ